MGMWVVVLLVLWTALDCGRHQVIVRCARGMWRWCGTTSAPGSPLPMRSVIISEARESLESGPYCVSQVNIPLNWGRARLEVSWTMATASCASKKAF